MSMSPAIRKFTLTIHLSSSVGWIGAVIAYLALVLTAMARRDPQTVQAVWFALESIGWYVIVPLAVLSLLTGLVMSLGTPWGLFRHYWVVISLVLTLVATIILVLHMPTVSTFAKLATETPNAAVDGLQGELLHGGIGLLVLVVVQVLNIYKPRGLTTHGWQKQQERRTVTQS
jgi:hypothetical protein